MGRTLDNLLDQNVAWAHRKTAHDPQFFSRLAEQQSPRLMWIGCSDSRITANDVLGLDPGEVFVHRNIANVVHTSDMNVLSVLEFAVKNLGVEHVIVCGHYRCGGVNRALSPESDSLLDHWLQPISMLYRKHRSVFDALQPTRRLDLMCEINVEMQVRRLAATPIVENCWMRGQELHLHGWIYGIHDGLLRDLGPHLSSIEQRDALPSIDDRVHAPADAVSARRRHAFEAFGAMPDDHPDHCCARPLSQSQGRLS